MGSLNCYIVTFFMIKKENLRFCIRYQNPFHIFLPIAKGRNGKRQKLLLLQGEKNYFGRIFSLIVLLFYFLLRYTSWWLFCYWCSQPRTHFSGFNRVGFPTVVSTYQRNPGNRLKHIGSVVIKQTFWTWARSGQCTQTFP